MIFLVVVLSILMVAVGAYGMASPDGLVSFARKWQGQRGVWLGALIRIVLGVALWASAPSSHTPTFLEVLGVISLISGIALLWIGAERLTELISWWSGQSSSFRRGWAAMAVALGAFLLWSTAA